MVGDHGEQARRLVMTEIAIEVDPEFPFRGPTLPTNLFIGVNHDPEESLPTDQFADQILSAEQLQIVRRHASS
jgi:hypothetical protein